MPKKHVKPTKEELEANINKSIEELEAPVEETPEEEPEEAPVVEEEVVETPEETPEEEPQEEEPVPSKEVIKDIAKREKEKLIASAQEAQILHSKNKKLNESLEKALNVEEPTEAELQGEYQDWDMMSDFEKKMAKDSLTNKRRMSALDEIVKENKDLEGWVSKVDEFVGDPANLAKYTQLDGKQEEFKLFATKPTRRGVDFEDLVSAFLFNEKPEPKKTGQMFEKGTGGQQDKGKEIGKISVDEARELRKNDYKKYMEMVKSGKIDLGL